jgi:hypothetical protein
MMNRRHRGLNWFGSISVEGGNYAVAIDPGLMEDGELAATSYDAFALIDSRRSALLFEGHIQRFDGNARVFLTDRRAL